MKRPPRANLLMIEGTTDALVANHLADWHGIPDYYDYIHYEGIEPLLVALPRRVRESERNRVAVVVDADNNPAARWMSVRDRGNARLLIRPCHQSRSAGRWAAVRAKILGLGAPCVRLIAWTPNAHGESEIRLAAAAGPAPS